MKYGNERINYLAELFDVVFQQSLTNLYPYRINMKHEYNDNSDTLTAWFVVQPYKVISYLGVEISTVNNETYNEEIADIKNISNEKLIDTAKMSARFFISMYGLDDDGDLPTNTVEFIQDN